MATTTTTPSTPSKELRFVRFYDRWNRMTKLVSVLYKDTPNFFIATHKHVNCCFVIAQYDAVVQHRVFTTVDIHIKMMNVYSSSMLQMLL